MKKVLMLSLDDNMFSRKSTDTRERQKNYEKGLKRLTILVFTRKKYKVYNYGNLKIIPTNSGNIFKGFFDFIKIIKNLKIKSDFDVITTQDPFFLGIIGKYASKLFKAKLKPQIHTEAFSNKYWRSSSAFNYIQYIIGLLITKRCDSIRVVSKRTARYFKKNKIKTEFIPISTDLSKFNCKGTKKEIDILFVGRLVKAKNLFFLIDVIGKLRENFPKIKNCIIGDGPLNNKLKKYVLKKGLKDNIKFVGNLNHNQLKKYYQKSKIFLLPSLYEGWGLVCIEASMAEVPVIMSNTGCAGEIVINNKSGLVCEINNQKAFINALSNYMKDKKLRDLHAKNAKKLCLEKLKTTRLRQRWVNFLNE